MIRLVVVAMIDAASPDIGRVGNLAHDFSLVLRILQVEYAEMSLSLHVNVNGRERTSAFVRTSVGTTHRSTLWCVFGFEPSQ